MTVVNREGVVSSVSCSDEEAHVVNTWNSYLEFPRNEKDPNKMRKTTMYCLPLELKK